MCIRVPFSVKLYIYEVLFFDDINQKNSFLSLSDSDRHAFLDCYSEGNSDRFEFDYFESDSVESLELFLSSHSFKDIYYINPDCEFSREVQI